MKDKRNLIILLSVAFVLAFVVVLITRAGFLRKSPKQEKPGTGLPESVERYYQESAPKEPTSPIKDDSDLEALSDEIDSTSFDFDSDLRQLDKDFASF